MPTFRSLARAVCVVVPAFGVTLTLAPEAQANSGLSGFEIVGRVIVGCIVAGVGDLVLTGSDIVYLSNDRRPPIGWGIAKVALGAPQAVFYDGLAGYTAAINGDRDVLIVSTFAGAYTGSLTANGIWSLAQDRDPLSLYGFSWAIGANTAFTSAAIGTLVGRSWPGRAFGILEMVATAPSLAVGAIRMADPTSERIAWGAIMGWSGVLFTHGLVSALHKDKNDDGYARTSSESSFPPRFHFGPTMVTDGIQRVPGFSVGGVF
jgi:hypothetical protein